MSIKKKSDTESRDENAESLLIAQRNTKSQGSDGDDTISGDDKNDKLDGADGDDHLQGGQGSDDLKGGSGDDDLSGDDGDDKLSGDDGNDFIRGGSGKDSLSGGNGNDDLSGDDGNDTLSGGYGDDYLNGGSGNDVLTGGLGDDHYQIDSVRDRISESANSGIDSVISSVSYELGKNIENLTLTGSAISAEGNKLANILIGNDLNNLLEGGDGHDVLTGNAGADSFMFNVKNKAASSDVITDFSQGLDKLLIEAKGLKGQLSADQFKAIQSNSPIELDLNDRFVFETDTGNLYYDRDGSGTSDMVLLVTLTGISTLNSSDIEIF